MRKFLAIGRYEASFGKERDDVYGVFDSLKEAIESCLKKDEKGYYVMVDGSDDPIEEITEVEFKDDADQYFENHDYMRFEEVKSWRKSELDNVFRTEEEEEELLERQRDAAAKERHAALTSGEMLRRGIHKALTDQFGCRGTDEYTDKKINDETDTIMKYLGFRKD